MVNERGFLLTPQQFAFPCHPFGFHHEARLLAVVEEGDLRLAVGIELQVGVPVEGAPVVLLPLLGRVATIVGLVEIGLAREIYASSLARRASF